MHLIGERFQQQSGRGQEIIKKRTDCSLPLLVAATRKALVWGSCWAHTAKFVKEYLRRRGIRNIVDPGGLTPYIQAVYVDIYKILEDKLSPELLSRNLMVKWSENGLRPYNPSCVQLVVSSMLAK